MNCEQGLVNETENLILDADPNFDFKALEDELISIPVTECENDWMNCRRSKEGLFYWKFKTDKKVQSGDLDNPSWDYGYYGKFLKYSEVRELDCFQQYRIFVLNNRYDLAKELIDCGRVSSSFAGANVSLPPLSDSERKNLNKSL